MRRAELPPRWRRIATTSRDRTEIPPLQSAAPRQSHQRRVVTPGARVNARAGSAADLAGTVAAMYTFLSDEWMQATHEIRVKYESQMPPVTMSIRINQVITDVPF